MSKSLKRKQKSVVMSNQHINLNSIDLSKCRVKYTYLTDDNGKALNIVSNVGLKKYEKACVTRQGEYHGFCVEAQEDIPSVLTNHHIRIALEHVKKNDLEKASRSLNIFDKFQVYGENVIYYVIDRWLTINGFDHVFKIKNINESISESISESSSKSSIGLKKDLDDYVGTQRHHPIRGKIKIVDIGTNTKTKEPVVPPEWLGKIFNSAHELHDEMNNLPQRRGKAPVTFCCVYSNSIVKNETWKTKPNLKKGDIVYKVKIDKNRNLITTVEFTKKSATFDEQLLALPDKKSYVQIDERIFEKNTKKNKTESVGYLSSLLQKCIRRGINNVHLLDETMRKLNVSPSYNLPDHNFATVSGTRQLLWRSFISIVEDVKGYLTNDISKKSIDMFTLALLAIVCQLDPTLSLSNESLEILIETVKTLQCYPSRWLWRAYDMCDLPENFEPEILRNLKNNSLTDSDQIKYSLIISLNMMPMMSNDHVMLRKAISYVEDVSNQFEQITDIKQDVEKTYFSDDGFVLDLNEATQTRCAGMDMHCKPTMLIELQAMLNLEPIHQFDEKNFLFYVPTLEMLSGYIWDNFSSNNFRFDSDEIKHHSLFEDKYIKKYKLDKNLIKLVDNNVFDNICELQEQLVLGRKDKSVDWAKKHQPEIVLNDDANNLSLHEKTIIGRTAWLSIFGKKNRFTYKNKTYDVFMGGDNAENLLKVKKIVNGKSEYVEGDLRKQIQDTFLKELDSVTKQVVLPNPPEMHKWIFEKKSVQTTYDLSSNTFFINDQQVNILDLYDQLIKIPKLKEYNNLPTELEKLVKTCTYTNPVSSDNYNDWFGADLLYRLQDVSKSRRSTKDHRLFNWKSVVNASTKKIKDVWRIILARIYTSDIDGINGKFTLTVGPCDRRGKKTNNSIHYQLEGTMYRLFLMFEMLYPFMINRKPGSMRWSVNKTLPEYQHLIDSVNHLCTSSNKHILNSESNKSILGSDENIANQVYSSVDITSKLWEHQEKTSAKIFNGLVKNKKRGFGDASHVGSGKTLCALSVFHKLYQYNSQNMPHHNQYSGFLVMLPSAHLIKTWTDEIKKHTTGFDLLLQKPNGDFTNSTDSSNLIVRHDKLSVKQNTVIITTMGRIRDHPVQHPWILVVIDECLTVQNKEALQTEEAWRQSCYSEYGVVMLSATFFRSRFDKMLYMIKMLKTGLPEERDYLDAILNESIISNITESERVWTITNSKINMTPKQKNEYEDVFRKNSSSGSEILYMALRQFIDKNIDYVELFYDQIDELEKSNKKILIFTKSKSEATALIESSRNNNRVSRYPDKSKTHTVLSFTEGTYGLNDLVIYDTILMRPPEPDKLPQIKGRLDRPGQKFDNLSIRYIILKDTIEEASLTRLEICNNFYNNYLMPLAEFYDLAVNNSKNSSNSIPSSGEINKIVKVSKKNKKKPKSSNRIKVIKNKI